VVSKPSKAKLEFDKAMGKMDLLEALRIADLNEEDENLIESAPGTLVGNEELSELQKNKFFRKFTAQYSA
jgi:hypothetical protein